MFSLFSWIWDIGKGIRGIRENRRLLLLLSFGLCALILPNSAFALLDPLVVYTEESTSSDDIIRYQTYSSGWSGEATGADTDDAGQLWWHVAESSPSGAEQVVLAVSYTSNNLYATLWDGTNWDDGSGSPFGDAKDMGTIFSENYRCFGAAYEQTSGQLLIVAGTSTNNQIKYWVWDGSSWVVDGSTFTFNISTIDDNVAWVEMAAKPDSNEIALMVVDIDKDAAGVIWDGDNNSWGNEKKLSNTAALSSYTEEQIAVEYMRGSTSESGKAVFVWVEREGVTGFHDDIYSWTWTGSAWEGSNKSKSNLATRDIMWIRLAADPNSDDLLLAVVDTNEDIFTLNWTGSAWGTGRVIEQFCYGDAADNRPFDVIFEDGASHTGHALIVYADTGALRYQHTSDITGAWDGESSISTSNEGYWIEAARADDNTIHAAVQDYTDDLAAFAWDNSSWTTYDNLETALNNSNLNRDREVIAIATATAAPMSISSLDYDWGSEGATITISGISFGDSQGSGSVKFFDNKTAGITSWANSEIVVTVPTDATDGDITVTNDGSETDTYSTFDVITGAPTFTAITPSTGSDFGDLEISSLAGTNLSPGVTLKLTKSGQSDITATSVSVSDSGTISTATFDLTSAATGAWSVVITNPDTQSVTETDGFTVQEAKTAATDAQSEEDSLKYANQRNLVRDSNGSWYVVFEKGGEIFINKRADDGNWGASPTKLAGDGGIILDTSNKYFNNVSVDVYRSGNVTNDTLHVVWQYGSGALFKYVYYSQCTDLANYDTGTSWSQVDGGTSPRYDTIDSALSSSSTYRVEYPDVAVDSSGNPHVAYYRQEDTTYKVNYRTVSGGDWDSIALVATSAEPDYSSMLGYPSIDTDSSDNAHVSWTQVQDAASDYVIRYAKSTDWSSRTDVIVDDNGMGSSSLAIDDANHIWIVTVEDTDNDLWYAYYNGSSWSETNQTNGSLNVTCTMVGTKLGTGVTDHILMAIDTDDSDRVVYWQWKDSTSDWSTYSEPIDTGDRSTGSSDKYLSVERNAPSYATNVGFLFHVPGASIHDDGVGGLGQGPTAVDLISFTARGEGDHVVVEWATSWESDHFGFNVYRASRPGGPYTKLTDRVIPGSGRSPGGSTYRYEDREVIPGMLYYYKVEDIDIWGERTMHGPVCVDWDRDGMADDWEMGYGLNPLYDESGEDIDGDGLSNLEEYHKGTDPLSFDTDGDGIPDGQESWRRDREAYGESVALSAGVSLVSSDETGMTLELHTDAFATESVAAGGEIYERLRIDEYIHGFTPEVGQAELPLKGVLIDLPAGVSARFGSVQTEVETQVGFRVYPVPERSVHEAGGLVRTEETFVIDPDFYGTDRFYPEGAARLGETVTFRDQNKLQVLFYPLAFNPARGEIRHARRIRVRIDYEGAQDGLLMGASGPATAAWSPPGEAYKVSVSEAGIYRLTRADLSGAGADVGTIDLSEVRLYHLGQEVAIRIDDVDGDDLLDVGDSIEFYATGVDASYQKYTADNLYWLTLSGGSGTPKRMADQDGTPGGADVALVFAETRHQEQDLWYWRLAPGEDSLDRWFDYPFVLGDGVAGGGDPVEFTLSVPDPVGSGTLTLSMAGTYDTDHEVRVSINGSEATFTWSGVSFTQGVMEDVALVNGDNTVTLECLSGEDSIALDWMEVAYERGFVADGDSLTFSSPAGSRYQITGFTTSDLLVFDITDRGDPKRIIHAEVTGNGPYTVEFEPLGASGQQSYRVLSVTETKSPAGISQDTASSLSDSANGADYILVTRKGVGLDNGGVAYGWLDDLITLRQSQGLRTAVVDIEDVYDEFSYGMATPQALKDFLGYAYTNWQPPAPAYVVLLGDGSYDYKNNWSWFLPDPTGYLPTAYTFTEYGGESASDDWFAQISGEDAVPDLHMGRIPAADASQAEIMVRKIIDYESASNTKTWERNVLLVSDDETEAWEDVFEIMNERVAALMPPGLDLSLRGYLNDYVSAVGLRGDLIDQINAGVLLVHYSGHAGRQSWAVKEAESVFRNADVDLLTNADAFPLVVSMSCDVGDFVYPEAWGSLSLIEALLRPDGTGAVSAFGPTGRTTTPGQRILDGALFEALFTQDVRLLGEAVSLAKQTLLANGAYQDVAETFQLFGDPATALKIPIPRRPRGVSSQSGDGRVTLGWQEATDSEGGPVDGYNVYRSTTAGSGYTQINESLITDTVYTDTGLTNGMTYYYVITSVDTSGLQAGADPAGDESVQSQELSATPTSPHSSSSGGCFVRSVKNKF